MIKPDTLEKPVKVVYLGIGSNIGNRFINIEKAKFLLLENNISLISASSYYETPSWPDPKKPKFINIVLKAFFTQSPNELLDLCKKIEIKLGRKKNIRKDPLEQVDSGDRVIKAFCKVFERNETNNVSEFELSTIN